MLRRNFLALALTLASTCGVHADKKVWRIAYLTPAVLDNPTDIALLNTFKNELVSLGYEEGRNFLLFARGADGNNARLPELAEQLVALHPDVIVAVSTPAIAAAQRATRSIPIVMTPATDPVGSGFVKTLAEPGTNITGLANMFGDLTEKSVELLHTILPAARRVAILMSTNPTHPAIYTTTQVAAQRLGLLTVPIIARTADDLDEAFQAIRSSHCDAVLVLADPIRPTIVTYAANVRIPTLYQFSEYVDNGGLASYGPNLSSIWRRSARYVDSILKGANPSTLPVEQPTTFEMVLNLRAAKLLGLSIPDSVLARADRVIE